MGIVVLGPWLFKKDAIVISKVISRDIVNYLLIKKGYSQNELVDLMDITTEKIDSILHNKDKLAPYNIISFTKKTDIKFWQIIYEGIPQEHYHFLPEKAIQRSILCKQLSDAIKRKKERS